MSDKRLDTLETTLKQIVDWLKFAEAKNGALIAIGCAVIFGAFRVYLSLSIETYIITAYVISFVIFVTASIIISLASFIPRMTPPFWIKMPEKEKGDNPLFFGHACKYSKSAYYEFFNNHVDGFVGGDSKLELAFCDQIVNNSKIAFIKYRMFGSAVFLFLAGLLTPIGALIFYWIRE